MLEVFSFIITPKNLKIFIEKTQYVGYNASVKTIYRKGSV